MVVWLVWLCRMHSHLARTMTAGHRELCIMACVFCKSADFQAWIQSMGPDDLKAIPFSEPMAKAFLLHLCQVESRNELDTNPAAAERFHELVRKPFLAWKNQDQGEDTFYAGMETDPT